VLVGHSMGGMTVMALADSRPELFDPDTGRVAGVALIATSAGKVAAVTLGLPALLAKFTGPVLPLLLRGARRQVNLVERGRALGSDLAWLITRRMAFGSPDVDPSVLQYLTTMIASTRIDVIADFYGTLMSHDKLSALKRLHGIPTCIICGDRDLLTPLEHSEAMAAELADAELVVVPDTGHLVLMECPDRVNEAIAELVAGALDADPPSAGRWWRRT
jgi:pimeloyl-ACP methyl ester carboxylesterase